MTRIELVFDQEMNRLAAYQTLEPWIRDRRVLELGCGEGHGIRQIFALGARVVVGMDRDIRRVAPRVVALEDVVSLRSYRPPRLGLSPGDFDVLIVNDLSAILGSQSVFQELCAALRPDGLFVVRAESGDRPGASRGVTYGALLDLVEPAFDKVRVFGQSPFVAYSLVELTETGSGELDITLDGSLMGSAVEEVDSYLVLCGTAAALGGQNGYGIVQVPTEGDAALERWWDSQAQEASESHEEGHGEDPIEPEDDGEGEQAVPTEEPRETQAPPPTVGLPLEAYTDGAGGRVTRWRWPSG